MATFTILLSLCVCVKEETLEKRASVRTGAVGPIRSVLRIMCD